MSTIPIFGTTDRLPRHVGGLVLTDLEQYDDALAGVRLQYRTRAPTPPDNPGGAELTKADSYLYSPQMIVRDMNAEDVDLEDQFGAALAQIVEAGKLGYYADVEIVSMEELLIQGGGAPNQWMSAEIRYRQRTTLYRGDRWSHLAVRLDDGYVNKVRYTYPTGSSPRAGESGFARFLAEWQDSIAWGIEADPASKWTAGAGDAREGSAETPESGGFSLRRWLKRIGF